MAFRLWGIGLSLPREGIWPPLGKMIIGSLAPQDRSEKRRFWGTPPLRAQQTRRTWTSRHLGRIDLGIDVRLCSPTHSPLWSGSVAHGDCAPQFRVAGDLPSKGFPLLKNCM